MSSIKSTKNSGLAVDGKSGFLLFFVRCFVRCGLIAVVLIVVDVAGIGIGIRVGAFKRSGVPEGLTSERSRTRVAIQRRVFIGVGITSACMTDFAFDENKEDVSLRIVTRSKACCTVATERAWFKAIVLYHDLIFPPVYVSAYTLSDIQGFYFPISNAAACFRPRGIQSCNTVCLVCW